MTRSRDSGQIGVLVVAAAAIVMAAVQGSVRFGDALVDTARAQSVADAVALAVAAERSDVLDDLTRGSGVVVQQIDQRADVTVRVSVDGRAAVARAASTD